MRATICSLVIGTSSGCAVRIAATAPAAPALDATISMSASSCSSPQASRSAARVITAECCASSSNGNCATPSSVNGRGNGAARLESHSTRTWSSLPSGFPAASISAWFRTMPGGAIAASRSRPATIVHGRRVPGSIPVRVKASAGPRSWAISPLAVRIGTASEMPGNLATAAAAAVASFIRMPPGNGESVAVTRTSKPRLSSKSPNDTTRPRDSSSMSNSRAPTAAIPRIPSEVRPGCRMRLRAANAMVFIGASATAPSPLSNDQDEAKMAVTPRGTATAIDRRATPGVIRTNTSAVSYRHWKNWLMPPCISTDSTMPKTAPAMAITTPSASTCCRMRERRKPMSRRMPTVDRRSSTSISISASRNTLLARTVTMAIARWNRSSTTNGAVRRSSLPVRCASTPGIVFARRRAVSRAWAGSRNATLMASTVSAARGSDARASRATRSGRCRRTSRRAAPRRIGSGVGSYWPTTRKRRGSAPVESVESLTVSPTRSRCASINWRDTRMSGTAGGVSERSVEEKAATAAQSSATVTGRRPTIRGQTHCGGGVIDASGVGPGSGLPLPSRRLIARTVMS